jgi:hypothetical protein
LRGRGVTFVALAGVAMVGLALVALLMPETRPAATQAPTAAERHGARLLAPA